MAEVRVINEKPITMVEMQNHLDAIKKRDKELNFRAKKVKDYLDLFVTMKKNQVEELKNKISMLNINRLKDRHIVKMVDILPKDIDSLRSVFVGENITVKQEELDKILETLKDTK